MCLYTDLKRPITAKRDIVVYKLLNKSTDGFDTAVCRKDVNLNSFLEADDDFPCDTEQGNGTVGKGAIHAYAKISNFNYLAKSIVDCIPVLYKAIIKKGTPFYYDNNFQTVAAKKLYVTDQMVWKNETKNDLLAYLTEENERGLPNDYKGVRIGDVCLHGDTFVHVDEINPDDDAMMESVKGVVGFFKGKNPVIIGLTAYVCDYEYVPVLNMDETKTITDIKRKSVYRDFDEDPDGEENTKDIVGRYGRHIDRLLAISFCKDYKTLSDDNGDWYIPSLKELDKIIHNKIMIDNTLDKLGSLFSISNKCFYSSNEYDDKYIWVSCNLEHLRHEKNPSWCPSYRVHLLPCQTIRKQTD